MGYSTGIARSRVQTPLKSWLFQASIRNWLNCVHNWDDHGLLDSSFCLIFDTFRCMSAVYVCVLILSLFWTFKGIFMTTCEDLISIVSTNSSEYLCANRVRLHGWFYFSHSICISLIRQSNLLRHFVSTWSCSKRQGGTFELCSHKQEYSVDPIFKKAVPQASWCWLGRNAS